MMLKQSRYEWEVGDVKRTIASNDQSNIYHFKKQNVDKLTSQARNTNDLHRVLL
jgi:hypothetical protein